MEIYTDRGVIKHGKYWEERAQHFLYLFKCSLTGIYFSAQHWFIAGYRALVQLKGPVSRLLKQNSHCLQQVGAVCCGLEAANWFTGFTFHFGS